MKNCTMKFLLFLVAAYPFTATAQQNFLPESRSVAVALMQQLGAELKKEMAAGGPAAAINVCTKIAPELVTKFSIENGWRVTRVALKTRNALLGTPDAWEQQALKDFNARALAGDALDKLEFSEIVTEPNGQYFRYLKALPMQPLCVACHGSAEQISESVKSTLAQRYPHDRAIGYEPGQVRGAISIKRLVP